MKILVIAPTPFFSDRGCHLRILSQAKQLKKKKHVIKILTYHLGKTPKGLVIERIPNFFWYKRIDTDASWHKIYLDLFLLLKTFVAIFRFKPDVIHCHLHEGAFIGIFLRPVFRGKIIFDCQGLLSEELVMNKIILNDGYIYKFFYLLEKIIYKLSSTIIVSSELTLNLLVSKFSVPINKLYFVPDGVDLKEVSHDPKVINRMVKKLNVPKNKKIIIYLGSLSYAHGIDDIINVAYKLSKIRKDVFWIIGGYPNEDIYREKVNGKGLEKVIAFYGRVNSRDIYNFLDMGNFAIVLKRYESQGNLKILHYALSRLPIICYDLPANRSLIDGFGWYLPINRPAAFKARALSKYLDTPEDEIKNDTQALRTIVNNSYNLSTVVDKLENIYVRES